MIRVLIEHEKDLFEPAVVEGVTLSRAMGGVASTLKCKVYKDDILDFTEGDRIRVLYDDKPCFNGFIFEKSRDSNEFINITAYDQVRYLKNKYTYVFKDLTCKEVIETVCKNFNLKYKDIPDTKYKAPIHVSDNKTLLDLIYWYIYTTQINTKVLYELYDDDGYITLKDVKDMKLDYLLDADVISDYSYKSSIDKDTYNSVALIQNEKGNGEYRKYTLKTDHENIKQWGILQYFEKVDGKEDINKKAEDILKLKNRKTRNLSIKGALGDIIVRGGSAIVCQLNLGDINLSNYMVVKKVTHHFNNDEHTMDLVLIGDGFNE